MQSRHTLFGEGVGQVFPVPSTPILAQTSATGTLLRRKLEPVIEPLLAQYAVLRGRS